MSPTEFELRAALREGEGDGPDADQVIHRAVEYRRQRRTRIGSGLAAAVVVAGVAVGGGFLIGSGGGVHDTASGSSAGSSQASDKAGQRSAAGGAAAPQRNGFASMASLCPSTVPHLMVPGGGGTGQFGGGSDLLPSDLAAVVVCAYGTPDAPTAPTAVAFSGAAAHELAASLNAAAPVHHGACPDFATLDTRQFVVIGTDADGRQSDPVVVTLADNPCQSQATNGTALRYGWHPPTSVASAFPAAPVTRVPEPQHS